MSHTHTEIIASLNIVDCRYALSRLRRNSPGSGVGVQEHAVQLLIDMVRRNDIDIATIEAGLESRASALEEARVRAYDLQMSGRYRDACAAFQLYFKVLGSAELDTDARAAAANCSANLLEEQAQVRLRRRLVMAGLMVALILWAAHIAITARGSLTQARQMANDRRWDELGDVCTKLDSSWLRIGSCGLLPLFKGAEIQELRHAAASGSRLEVEISQVMSLIDHGDLTTAYARAQNCVREWGKDIVVSYGVKLGGPIQIHSLPGATILISRHGSADTHVKIPSDPGDGSARLGAVPVGQIDIVVSKVGFESTTSVVEVLPFQPLDVAVTPIPMPVQFSLIGPENYSVFVSDKFLGSGGDTINLAPGQHSSTVKAEGHVSKTINLSGSPGEHLEVRLPQLEELKVPLRISATIGGAQEVDSDVDFPDAFNIVVDGRDYGDHQLPATIMVSLGTRDIQLINSNYTMIASPARIVAAEGGDNTIVVTLNARAASVALSSALVGARLRINGSRVIRVGETDILMPGRRYQFAVEAPGYAQWTQDAYRPKAGERLILEPRLIPLPSLVVKCSESNMQVSVNGQVCGRGNGTYALAKEGYYNIQIDAEGYYPWIATNTFLKNGESTTITPVLEPLVDLVKNTRSFYEEGVAYLECQIKLSESTRLARCPRDFVILLDNSVSMKSLVPHYASAIESLAKVFREGDRIEVVTFSEKMHRCFGYLAEPTESNVKTATLFLSKARASGGTDLEKALTSISKLRNELVSDRQVILCLVSDGIPSVGNNNLPAIFEELSTALKKTLVLYTLFYGASKDDLLEVLARRYGGQSYPINNYDTLRSALLSIEKASTDIALHGCTVSPMRDQEVIAPSIRPAFVLRSSGTKIWLALSPDQNFASIKFTAYSRGRLVTHDLIIRADEALPGDVEILNDWRLNTIYDLYWQAMAKAKQGSSEKGAQSVLRRFVDRYGIPVNANKTFFDEMVRPP